MSERPVTAIRSPDTTLEWADFPRYQLQRPLYRAAKRGMGAWYFCNCGGCRFDLVSPRGTCYAGMDPVSALMETIGPDWCAGELPAMLISDLIEERQMHSYVLPQKWHLANLKHRRAAGFRVSNELSDMTPYDVPREYADLFDATQDKRGRRRFRGIRFQTRFDTGVFPLGIALFGKEGEKPWVSIEVREIGAELIAELASLGIFVEDLPVGLDDLDLVKDD